MPDILKDIEKRYFLNFGGYNISPVSAVSVAMILEYINDCSSGRKDSFIINFPNKEGACVPLITGMMINLFFTDYIYQQENQLPRTDFSPGKNVEVFNSVATVKRYSGEKLVLTFARELEYTLEKASHSFVSATHKSRLSKYQDFVEKKKSFFNRRNALSQIFEPYKTEIIIPEYLTSKILLVTGRGSLGKTKTVLGEIKLFGEPLADILRSGKNLLLSQDLEAYKSIFDNDFSLKSDRYRRMFKLLSEKNNNGGSIDHDLLSRLNMLIAQGSLTTKEYTDSYQQLLDSLDENDPLTRPFFNLPQHHPGISSQLPPNLRAVVINDIYIYDLYKHTIQGFLNAGVPVICLCDTIFKSRDSIGFYQTWLDENIHCRKLSWTSGKIAYLNTLPGKGSNYIDHGFWQVMINSSIQRIYWERFDDAGIDRQMTVLSQKISSLEGFELLKDAWWRYLIPAFYICKNTPQHVQAPVELVALFETVMMNQDPEAGLKDQLEILVENLKKFRLNSKYQQEAFPVFSQQLGRIGSLNYELPVRASRTLITTTLSPLLKKICFSGYPYREWIQQDLMKAVKEYCIPEIRLLLWPDEYSLTRSYIRSRLMASYFPDNYQGSIRFPENLMVSDRKSFEDDINARMLPAVSAAMQAPENINPFLEVNFNLQHRNYIVEAGRDEGYAVRCDIIYFANQDFLYLPYGSRLLITREFGNHEMKVEKSDFAGLTEGTFIFQYRLTRADLRDLARQNAEVSGAFQVLEQWKTVLKGLYLSFGNDLNKLETHCRSFCTNLTGGNPSRQNLQRWLFDDDLISPEKDNLNILMLAAGMTETGLVINSAMAAAGRITGFTISIASQVKNAIINELNKKAEPGESFELYIYGKKINVETREIIALEKADALINYNDTKKIIR